MKNSDLLIEQYLEKILEANEKINLTNIKDIDSARLLHIEDSLAVLQELDDAPEGLYGDLGSGGGFPGVPLAIKSGRETVLIDSVKKKMNAVSEILEELGLSEQIKTDDGRIEEISLKEKEQFSVLTARALAKLPVLLELAAPLLKTGGRLICLKSHTEELELQQAIDLKEKLGMIKISDRNYYLSDNETYREVFVFEKFKDSEIELPRRTGMAQKRPLKA